MFIEKVNGGIKIGRVVIVKRHPSSNWKKYIIPKETQNSKTLLHSYFRIGIWWLCFAIYMGRKCRICKTPICPNGGVVEYGRPGKHSVICKHCAGEGKSPYIHKDMYSTYSSCTHCSNIDCKWNII